MLELNKECTSKTVFASFENKIDIENIRNRFIYDERINISKRNKGFYFDDIVAVKFVTGGVFLSMAYQLESCLEDALSYIQKCMPELGQAKVKTAMKVSVFDLPENIQFDDVKKYFVNSKIRKLWNNKVVLFQASDDDDKEYESFVESIE